MQIVIDIPEGNYKTICETKDLWETEPKNIIYAAIANGIPLPKGHGRLIDADELKKEYPHDTDWEYPVNTNSYVVESIDNMTAIIEADKEQE